MAGHELEASDGHRAIRTKSGAMRLAVMPECEQREEAFEATGFQPTEPQLGARKCHRDEAGQRYVTSPLEYYPGTLRMTTARLLVGAPG